MTTIRPMHPEDFEEIRQIDQSAFGDYEQHRGREARRLVRTHLNLLNNWKEYPEGCLVAEESARLLGFIFAHVWGRLGWIGTFAVRTEVQSEGIGKRLLREAVESLQSRGCTTIGLETMPESIYNVGFYMACGFRPDHLTLLMERTTIPLDEMESGKPVRWSQLDQVGREFALERMAAMTHAVQPGLNYTKLARLRIDGGEGEVAVFGEQDPWGFAVVRTALRFEEEKPEAALVEVLVIKRGGENRFPAALRGLDNLKREWGLSRLIVPVNARYWWATQMLLRDGFRVCHIRLRMLYQEEPVDDTVVNLSSWAM